MTQGASQAAALALQGHRAGFASRLAADAVDLAVVFLTGLLALLVSGAVRYLVAGPPWRLPVLPGWLESSAWAAIVTAYLASGWATTGRTLGKQLVGLRVARRSGRPLPWGRAVLRALLYLAFPAGLLWVLVSRCNASVQDLVVRSAVVYDWSYRSACDRQGQADRPSG